MDKILITGTKGFIGKNLFSKLKEKFFIDEINEDIFEEQDWLMVLNTKLFNQSYVCIFHIGAISNTLEKDVNKIMIRNFEFTKILVDYSKISKVPIVYSSSAACYGINNQYPSNLYGWSKYTAEQYVISNGGIALRYFNVYGPGEEKKENMASVAYQMWQNKLKNKSIKLFPGNPKRDFVYIEDVIDANIHAFENYHHLKGNYYEVGSGEARRFEDVLKLLEIEYLYTEESEIPKGYQFYTKSDCTKWIKGWKPRFNLERGLSVYKRHLN